MDLTPSQKDTYGKVKDMLVSRLDLFLTDASKNYGLHIDVQNSILEAVGPVVMAYREKGMTDVIIDMLTNLDEGSGETAPEIGYGRMSGSFDIEEKIKQAEQDFLDRLQELEFSMEDAKVLTTTLEPVNQSAVMMGRADGLNYIANMVPEQ